MNFTTLTAAIDTLRSGIENEDMEQIKKAFYELTGDAIDTPPKEEVQKEEVRVSTSSKDLDFSTEPKQETGKKRTTRREPIAVGKNQFTDDGMESKDVTTPNISLTPRSRPPAETVEVVCHVCKKTYQINPAVSGGEFYRCDGCVDK